MHQLPREMFFAKKSMCIPILRTRNIPYETTTRYALYFAKTPYDAQSLHSSIYGHKPSKWHSIYNQHKYSSVFTRDTGEEIYIFMLKERVKEFPYFIGEIAVGNG